MNRKPSKGVAMSTAQTKKITPCGNGFNGIRIETLFLLIACHYTLFAVFSFDILLRFAFTIVCNGFSVDVPPFRQCFI